MKAVRDKDTIQIEITNACVKNCANCTRLVGHQQKPYFMELRTIELALDSLADFRNNIGIMGGEPTTHPHFREICELVRKKVPHERRFLFTTGYKWDLYRSIIRSTFGVNVLINDHKRPFQKHHPMMIAVKDVVPDHQLAEQLIANCWVAKRWSASINPNGCFFCEIAAAQSILFGEPAGMPIQKGWWDKPLSFFSDQMKIACSRCGAPVPFSSVLVDEDKDYVSISNYNRLKALNTPRFLKNRIALIQDRYDAEQIKELSQNWKPWDHWNVGDTWPNCYEVYGKFYGFMTLFSHRYLHGITRLMKRTGRRLYSKGSRPPSPP
jgi:hypothetical protein